MIFKKKCKKILTLILLLAIILPLVYAPLSPRSTPKAHADLPVIDASNLAQTTISAIMNKLIAATTDKIAFKEYILDPLANAFAVSLIRGMTNSVIGWIQGGGGGFVDNLEAELRRELDKRGEEFLNQLSGVNLCGNIGTTNLQQSLRTPRGGGALRQQLECTVTDIVANVNSFFNDFSQGGWPAFIKLAFDPQNTFEGAYLIALDAKVAAETDLKESIINQYIAGKGFLGFRVPVGKNCVQDEQGNNICFTEYETKTPGNLVADLLTEATTIGFKKGVVADEIDEAIESIITALIDKIMSSSFGGGEGLFNRELSNLPSGVENLDLAVEIKTEIKNSRSEIEEEIKRIDIKIAEWKAEQRNDLKPFIEKLELKKQELEDLRERTLELETGLTDALEKFDEAEVRRIRTTVKTLPETIKQIKEKVNQIIKEGENLINSSSFIDGGE